MTSEVGPTFQVPVSANQSVYDKNEKQRANISWPPNPQYCNSLDVINTAEQIFAGETGFNQQPRV